MTGAMRTSSTAARTLVALAVGAATVLASCGSGSPLADAALAECTKTALAQGTIGGSSTLVPSLVLALPDDAIPPTGTPEEVEAAFDASFTQRYGLSVDEFLALRDDADAATKARLGDPPATGEQVSDQWFVERDTELMALWNERFPASARRFCDLVHDSPAGRP